MNRRVKGIRNWGQVRRNKEPREGWAASNLGLWGVFADCASSPRETPQFPVSSLDNRAVLGAWGQQPGRGAGMSPLQGDSRVVPRCCPPGAQRAVEDKGKLGLGFLPGIPNEWGEENGENLFLRLACGAQGIEHQSGYPAHKTRGFFQNPFWPHPLPSPALFSASSRAGTAGHTMPAIHLAPFSLHRPGLGFCGISLFFFYF